jgi:hypothetical protein
VAGWTDPILIVGGAARSRVGTPNVLAATPMPAAPVTFKKVLRSMPLIFDLFWLIAISPFVVIYPLGKIRHS